MKRRVRKVELVDVGKLMVTPFVFDHMLELKIERSINEHATLYVRGIVPHGWQDNPVTDAAEGTTVKCVDGESTYFSGVLQNVIITCEDDVYYLEAHAVSHTIKLDTEKFKRSFQEDGRTYEDIIGAITSEKGAVMHYNADARAIERILVQYDETDWQFAKRLASHTQDVLIAVSKNDGTEFHFGVEDEAYSGEIITGNYSIFKDFNLLRLISNDESPLGEGDITMYRVKIGDFSYGSFDAGEKVLLNGIGGLYVKHAILSLDQSRLISTYTLASKKAITAPKIYNRNITGLALEGIVTVVEGDDVKLDMHIDYGAGSAHFFKYATDYSPESHTGWYVMPEPGDTVLLTFPTEDERDTHAAGSIRQSSTGKTGDPQTKFLRTPYGREVKLDPDEVLITAVDDSTYIKLHAGTGIEIFTTNPVKIITEDTLDMISKGDMTIATEAKLKISAMESIEVVNSAGGENRVFIDPAVGIDIKTDTELSVLSKNDTNIESKTNFNVTSGNKTDFDAKESFTIVNQGNNMKFDPKTGISLTTDKMINTASLLSTAVTSALNTSVSGGVNTSIDAGAIMSLSSGLKMTIDGGLQLEGSAKTKLNMSTKAGSSISLAPQGVDVKGMMIKEG